MQQITSKAAVFQAVSRPLNLNVARLQAALCMLASAALSLALIFWIAG